MSCGVHRTAQQTQSAVSRNTHVATVAAQTVSRRAGTTSTQVKTNGRSSATAIRAAVTQRPQPAATKQAQPRSKASTTAAATARKTASATAAKTAHNTASAHAKATASATASKHAKATASAHAKATARKDYLAALACYINHRDALAVTPYTTYYYSGAYQLRTEFARDQTALKEIMIIRSANPRKATKALRASKGWSAQKSIRALRAK